MTDDDAIRALVTRLSRAHPAGGAVIERAAILAEGADAAAVLAWIDAHSGVPEELAVPVSAGGLHRAGEQATTRAPRRYVFPPGALAR